MALYAHGGIIAIKVFHNLKPKSTNFRFLPMNGKIPGNLLVAPVIPDICYLELLYLGVQYSNTGMLGSLTTNRGLFNFETPNMFGKYSTLQLIRAPQPFLGIATSYHTKHLRRTAVC